MHLKKTEHDKNIVLSHITLFQAGCFASFTKGQNSPLEINQCDLLHCLLKV